MAKTRGKGEGSIYRREDGYWCASVELPRGLLGERRRKVIVRKTKPEVVTEMRNVQRELSERGNILTSAMTVGQWMDYWLEKIHAPKVRPKTLQAAKANAAHVKRLIGRVRLDKLTPTHIRQMNDELLATPKDPELRKKGAVIPDDAEMLGATYARSIFTTLQTALKAAVMDGKIKDNPAERVEPPRRARNEGKALTLEQAIQLLLHVSTDPNGALWAAYLLTGARRGEVIGLEKSRVTDSLDLSWQLQRISNMDTAPRDFESRHLVNTLYLTRPKSAAGNRVIPLVEPLYTILHRHIEVHPRGELVFTRDDGLPYSPDDITKAWTKLLDRAGLPTDVNLHGARHTTIDLLYEAGVPEEAITLIVGHSNRAMSRSYRTTENRNRLRAAMTKLSALLSLEA